MTGTGMIPLPPADNQPGTLMAWMRENPTAIRDAIQLLNQLRALQVTVIQNGVTKTFPVSIIGNAGNAVIQLQL